MIGLVDGNNFFVSCERVFDPKLEGKAVAVLSNNDGCCVARSNEFKAKGIKMGTPYFQLKDREQTGELIFRSSNYELYGDMSRRIISILREEALEVEQYSIDEAFIVPPIMKGQLTLPDYGRRLRKKILQWTGIPCGVGFAPTKTLAKIANHIAKKRPEGVFMLPDDPTEILASLPVGEVWGVGKRLPVKLQLSRILTAKDLRDASDDVLRSIGGVTLMKVAMELRGIASHEERDYEADPDSVTCSRTFGSPVTEQEALCESIAGFAAQGAVKLRRHGMIASGCNIYAQYGTALDHGWVERTVVFGHPTSATSEILSAISEDAKRLYLRGLKYRKSGITYFGLEKRNGVRQMGLFGEHDEEREQMQKLYQSVDSLNARYGRGRVFAAAEGINRKWQMNRTKISGRMTTSWGELLVVSG